MVLEVGPSTRQRAFSHYERLLSSKSHFVNRLCRSRKFSVPFKAVISPLDDTRLIRSSGTLDIIVEFMFLGRITSHREVTIHVK